MNKWLKTAVAALSIISFSDVVNATSIPSAFPNPAPTGFALYNFYFPGTCTSGGGGGNCWNAAQIYDGTNLATVNSNGGLNTNILGTLPAFASTPTFNVGTTSTGGTIGSPVPVSASYQGANSSGNLTGIVQADHSVPINTASSGLAQIVGLSGSTKIYVTGWDVMAGGTSTFQLEYGTGSNCGTGTTALTGPYPLTAQSGTAPNHLLVVPAGNALCINVGTGSIQMSGSLSYTQF